MRGRLSALVATVALLTAGLVALATAAGTRPADPTTAYVANFNDDTASVINLATNAVTGTIGGLPGAGFTAVSPNGRALYVTQGNANKVTLTDTPPTPSTARPRPGDLGGGQPFRRPPVRRQQDRQLGDRQWSTWFAGWHEAAVDGGDRRGRGGW